jgi:hypothetical protein
MTHADLKLDGCVPHILMVYARDNLAHELYLLLYQSFQSTAYKAPLQANVSNTCQQHTNESLLVFSV